MEKARVMIIEDEIIVAHDLAGRLKRWGYEVVGLASSGEEAVEMARDTNPDLVLTDIKLRGAMDGIEASELIRAGSDAAVIYLTARTESDLLERAIETRPYGYLTKPVAPRDLLRSVEMALYKHRMEKRLRESESRFRAIFDQTFQFIGLMTTEGILIEANRAPLEFYELSQSHVIGMPFWDTPWWSHSVEQQERLRAAIDQAAAGEFVRFETFHPAPDGEVYYLDLSIKPVMDQAGNVILLIPEGRDITESKRAESALKAENRKFQIMVDNSPLGIMLIRQDGTFAYTNPQFEMIFGYGPGEIMCGRDWFRKAFPDASYRHKVISTWIGDQEKSTIGKRQERFFTVTCKDGSQRRIHFRSVALDVGQHLVACEDITESLRSREAFAESQERYRQLTQHSLTGIYIDQDGRFVFVNDRMVEIMGYPRDRILGSEFSSFLHPEDREQIEVRGLATSHDRERGPQVQFRVTRPDGEVRWLEVLTAPITYQGRPANMGNVLDITRRKRTEAQHLAHVRFLEHLDQLERSVGDVHSLDGAMGRVLETALSVFRCDQAWLMFPCDPEALSYQIPMERTRPECPRALSSQNELPVTPGMRDSFRTALSSQSPLVYHPEEGLPLPDLLAQYSMKSSIAAALFPKAGPPWLWGLSQYTHTRTWSEEDQALFKETGHRLSEALSSVLLFRDLQESEERYRLLAENVSDVIWTIDLNERFTYLSPSIEALIGFTPEETTERGLRTILTPPSYDLARKTLAEELARENEYGQDPTRSVYLELEHTRKDGSTVWTELKATFIRDAHGNPTGVLGVSRDIAWRREIEKNLRSSETNYRAIFDAANDAVFVHDVITGEIVDANKRMTEMFGYSRTEACSLTVEDLSSAKPPYTSREVVRRTKLAQTGEPQLFEWHARRKDGRLFWVEVNLKRARIGGADQILAVVRDISERKKVEEALRAEKEFSASLVDNAPTFFAAIDASGKILMMNRHMLQVLGYSAEEVVGKDYIANFVPEHEREALAHIFSALTTEHHHTLNENHILSKDGREFLVEWRGVPLFDRDGRFTRFYGVGIDITERKHLEDQLLRSQKMEAVGTLAGGVAHDFNNLLQVMHGYADMALLHIGEGEKGYSELQEIRKAALSAANLTESLLTFSRRVDSQLKPVNLNHEVEHVARILERTIPKMIEIELRLSENLPAVNADSTQLQQLIMNLGLNARDAMPNGGKLVIDTESLVLGAEYCKSHLGTQPGTFVVLSVTDTGFGMDRTTIEHIFEPFYTTKEVGKGTGLGLAIAYGIVESHGGKIVCSSEPNKGTSFKIYLPAIKNERRDELSHMNSIMTGGTETILFVDDEEPVRELGEKILSHFGYTVLTASDGQEGLEIFKRYRNEISIVILDLIMPEMDGRDCLNRILSIDPSAKVLISSGYGAEGHIDAALKDGARRSVPKPYTTRQLLDVVRATLDHD